MLINIKDFSGHKLAATDGEFGHVKNLYFDDQTWAVRYLVADTGSWLPGRLVLIAPYAFARFDAEAKVLHLNLTKQQIEHSPSIDAHRPVSRQYEENYYSYYGWPTYWVGGETWGALDYPGMMSAIPPSVLREYTYPKWDDIHLRSTKAVTGYAIQATDGELGTVSSFLVDDKRWVIRELTVEAGHWYSGKEILITPNKITRISYPESKVFVNFSKADIERTAEHHVVRASS